MAEIDMIPRSYRDAVRVGRAVRLFGCALAGVLVLGAVALAGLHWRIAVEEPRLALLRNRTALSEAASKQLALAQVAKATLEQRLAALAALRGAGEIARIGVAIDQSLNRGVWFKQLRFSREEQLLPVTPVAPPQTGYLVVLPLEEVGKPVESRTWQLSKNIEIGGEAIDHAALTEFLNRLSGQPGIADVRFLNSSGRAAEGAQVIDFNVTAATRNLRGAKP
jgi:hypothetical protein